MLRISPDQLYRIAVQHQRAGRLEQAEPLYRQVLDQQPGHALAHYSLGILLRMRGRTEEAIPSLRRATELQPDMAELHFDHGSALHTLGGGRLGEAITAYRLAIARKPEFALAYDSLALALKDLAQLDEAITCHRRAIELRPDISSFHENLIVTLQYSPGATAHSLREECLRWSQRHARFPGPIPPHPNDRTPDRPLRVGYVSADFHTHASAFFFVPLFQNHSQREVQIFCYAEGDYDDQTAQQIRHLIPNWRRTTGLSDDQLATVIRADQIDILIDLKLHTNQNRLLTFARKPAPIQITWLGYPGTTGLEAIDYRLTDPFLDPLGEHDDWYTEETLRLPDTFWCYDPLVPQIPGINEPPALSSGGRITFGSLNSACKINPGVLALWSRVLKGTSNSQLLLMAQEPALRILILDHLARHDIAPDRIQFATRQSRLPYLQIYNRIDIGLDTFPYNGHTTSLDSFFMGVPVITLVGQTVVGRAGYSQLMNLGLPELIARTPEEYLQIATSLAADLPRLQTLRATLRERMQKSPLMDAPLFAKNIEAAYRALWQRWCANPDRRPVQIP